jgi:hypothetical protein
MGFVVNTEMGYLVDLEEGIFSNDIECAVVFPNNLDKEGRRVIYNRLIGAGEVNRYWYEDKE